MTNNYPPSVGKIVDNYLRRVREHMRGIPKEDREEMLKEMTSHIYEAYSKDPAEDEIDKILNVLQRLGEPAEVIAERLPETMVEYGKKRKLPMYILGGFFFIVIGLPLGLGGLGVLIGLLVALAAFLVAYYAAAVSFVVCGGLGIVYSLIYILAPDIVEKVYHAFGVEMGHPPGWTVEMEGFVGLVGCLILAALGLGMLWLGKRMLRGIRFLFVLSWDKIKGLRGRRQQKKTVEWESETRRTLTPDSEELRSHIEDSG